MSFVWFILLIGGLIAIHEAGHLLAARLFDIGVLKLSIGFGPRLYATRRGETEYAISWIPLGGYIRLLGEEHAPRPPKERARAFCLRPPWQRMCVILAGPLANLVVPFLLFVHLSAQESHLLSPTIGAAFQGQPAAEADLRSGDRIIAVDDQPVRYWEEFNTRVLRSAGRELRITVERPGQERPLTKVVIPREHLRTDPLGVSERVGLIGVAPHYRLPQVGVLPDSAAAHAGLRTFDVILSVQGRPVATVADLEPLFHPHSGGMLLVTYLRPEGNELRFASLSRMRPEVAQLVPAQVTRQGRSHYDAGLRSAELFLHDVEPETPAAKLGLSAGDVLVALDGVTLTAWELFEQGLEERPLEPHTVLWRSADGREHEQSFRLEARRTLDEYQAESTLYVFGASSTRATQPVAKVPVQTPMTMAVSHALGRAMSVTWMLVRVLALTACGQLPATAIGGPILIYHLAGVAAQHGVEQFLVMAALVSLNIGLLNLLPVPLLDGGQGLLVLIEAVRRRPVSAAVRERAAYVGVALLVTLLLLASRNDLLRHLFR